LEKKTTVYLDPQHSHPFCRAEEGRKLSNWVNTLPSPAAKNLLLKKKSKSAQGLLLTLKKKKNGGRGKGTSNNRNGGNWGNGVGTALNTQREAPAPHHLLKKEGIIKKKGEGTMGENDTP